MEKKTKLGVAAGSLLAAATLMGATAAEADEACITCVSPDPGGGPFHKVDDPFWKVRQLLPAVQETFGEETAPFLKIGDVIDRLFIKVE